MEWKATIVSVEKNDSGNIKVNMSFTNGVRTEQTFFNVMPVSADDLSNLLKTQCLQQINFYNGQDAVASVLANPPTGEIDLTPPAPTQEQIDAQAELVKINKLTELKRQLDIQYITQDEYDAQVAEIK